MPKKVLILTYWGYKESLISSFTLPYIKLLHKVNPEMSMYLFTLNKRHQQLSTEEIAAANKNLGTFNTQLLSYNYNRFGIKAIFSMAFLVAKLLWLIRKEKITHIHAFCTPAGAIGYILKLFSNVKLVIDSYEPHAESMVESNAWTKEGLAYKILFSLEKKQSKAADHIISLTEGMRQYARDKYHVELKDFHVKPSCINIHKFNNEDYIKHPKYIQKLNLKDKVVGLYAGKFGGLYLEDETFQIFQAAYAKWKDNFHIIILGGTSKAYLEAKAEQYGIPFSIITKEFVSEEDLPFYMGAADFALTPVKPIPSKRFCSPIKNGEYWVLGLPIIITKNISDDSEVVEKMNIGYVLKELQENEYTNAINWIHDFINSDNIKEKKQTIKEFGIQNRGMDRAKNVYKAIYASS